MRDDHDHEQWLDHHMTKTKNSDGQEGAKRWVPPDVCQRLTGGTVSCSAAPPPLCVPAITTDVIYSLASNGRPSPPRPFPFWESCVGSQDRAQKFTDIVDPSWSTAGPRESGVQGARVGSKVLFHSQRYLLTGGKEGPGVSTPWPFTHPPPAASGLQPLPHHHREPHK